MSIATNSEAPTQPSRAASFSCTHDALHERKRARSPPYPPFVSEYRPYSSGQLQAHRVNQHTDLHKRQWDMYYRNNTVNGFKDRHYILREFHELRAAIDAAAATEKTSATDEAAPSKSAASASPACSFSWMEAGCGVGNAMLPVFAQYGHLPQWRALFGFDISSVAIGLLEEKRALLPPALAAKVHVCVLNPVESEVADCPFFTPMGGGAMTSSSSAGVAGAGGADGDSTAVVGRPPVCELPEFVSLIFVLCSIPVSSHAVVLRRIARCMACPGGVLYFRDYAVSDHAERRFQASSYRRRGDGGEGDGTGNANTYERTNGTLSHFFALEEVRTLFEGAGFEVVALDIIANEPDELKGKRVAIDASIWIAQFRARLAPGEDTEHKVLEGFLARILKLLFYGIRPVFVFDGPASSSKGAEHHRRTMQRARTAQALVKRRARQILMAQVAAGALEVEDLKAAMSSGAHAENNAVRAEKDSDVAVASMAASAAKGTGLSETVPRDGGTDHALGATSSASGSAIHGGKRPREASEEVLPLPRPHRRRLCLRQRRLAPDAVSATLTQSFLRDAEGLLEERTRHEACVLQNALQGTSTSLFMGPRRAVDENSEAVAGVITSGLLQPLHPHCTAAVVLVSGDSQERDDTGCVVISDSESDAEAVSSASCMVASTDSEEGSDVEEVVLVEKAGGPGRADAPEGALWLPSSACSPSAATAVLHSGDMTRFLNALPQSTCTPPPELMPPTIASERTASVITSSSSSAALSVSADEGIATDPGSSSTSSSKSPAFPSDGSSEEADSFTDGGDGDDSDDAEFAWEPFTQRLHLAQLLRPQEQESESHPDSLCSAAAQMGTASFAGSPRADATTVGKEDEDDDDYAPVRAVEMFSRCRTAPVPLPMVGSISSSGEGEKGNCTIPVSAPHHPNAVKGAVSEVAGAPHRRSAEVHSSSTDRTSSLGGVPPRGGGAARTHRVVIPFELLNVVELLDCCGVPYVLSPAEADAQCAFLARRGLVDAVFTEDSDVLVHGATTVLRGFFAQSKNVVAYEQTHLSACGITKTVLVALASLLGCDYTEGVCGIGLVGALEALVVAWTTVESAEAGAASSAVLHLLRRWALLVQRPPRSWQEVDDHMTILQFALLQAHVAQWRTLEQRACFPEAHAVEAFFDAKVDLDTTPFQWHPPDWQRIRVFAGALGALSSPWLVQRYELARKECLRREETAAKEHASLTAGQRRLTEYGVQERVRARWAFQRQPPKHAAALAKLRAVQQMQ